MKVALCYSGMVRSLFDCIDSHREWFFDKYDCDVFFHLWDIEGYVNGRIVNENESPLSDDTKQQILRQLNPVSFQFENVKQYADEHWRIVQKFDTTLNRYNGKNVAGMYHSIWKSHQLMQESQRIYDVVIRLRTDLRFNEVNISSVLPKHLYMPTIERYPYNDQFGYGDIEVMNAYANVYQTLLQEDATTFDMHPETALGTQMSRYGITIANNHEVRYHIINQFNQKRIYPL